PPPGPAPLGIREAAGAGTRVLYARGTDLVQGRQDPRAVPAIDPAYLRPAAGSSEQGLRGEYFGNKELTGTPSLTRVDPSVVFRWDRGSPTSALVARGEAPAERALPNDNLAGRLTG